MTTGSRTNWLVFSLTLVAMIDFGTSECKPGEFGSNCEFSCGSCDAAGCSPLTGCSACSPGWTNAPACDLIICDDSPCKNGGQCVQEENRCACSETYTGINCELMNENVCPVNHCHNSGSCYMKDGQPTCKCLPGLGGVTCKDLCQVGTDTCLHGTCSDLGDPSGRLLCDCSPGYYDDYCVQKCPNGYYGKMCNFVCGHCESPPCDHVTGHCATGCEAGWSGEVCRTVSEVVLEGKLTLKGEFTPEFEDPASAASLGLADDIRTWVESTCTEVTCKVTRVLFAPMDEGIGVQFQIHFTGPEVAGRNLPEELTQNLMDHADKFKTNVGQFTIDNKKEINIETDEVGGDGVAASTLNVLNLMAVTALFGVSFLVGSTYLIMTRRKEAKRLMQRNLLKDGAGRNVEEALLQSSGSESSTASSIITGSQRSITTGQRSITTGQRSIGMSQRSTGGQPSVTNAAPTSNVTLTKSKKRYGRNSVI